MKSELYAFLPLLMIASQPVYASAASPSARPERVAVSAQRIFTPTGFDDNDNAQVVIHGHLPDTCHKIASPKVTINEATHEILITPQAFSYPDCRRLDVLVSFTQTVDLGILSVGNYKIVELNAEGKAVQEAALMIAQARSGEPDDYLYAPVKQIRVEDGPSGPGLVLSGVFSNVCMEVQEVKVMYTSAHLIEILPIASYKAGGGCENKPRSFEVKVALPKAEPGETLVHVRSLNGQSVNSVELF